MGREKAYGKMRTQRGEERREKEEENCIGDDRKCKIRKDMTDVIKRDKAYGKEKAYGRKRAQYGEERR